jgi:hypothetical protein
MKKIICSNSKTLPSSRLFSVLSAGIISLGVVSLHAQTTPGLIDVDFNGNSVGAAFGGNPPGPAVGPTQSGAALIGSAGDIWNGFADSAFTFTGAAGPLSATGLALNFANGSSSGATMSLTASSTYDTQAFGNQSPFVVAGSPYQNLLQDLLVGNTPQTITLSGLAANQTFSLVLYNAGDNNVGAAGRTSSFTVNGVTQTSHWDGAANTLIAGTDYVQYSTVTSDALGNLVITYGPGAGASEGDLDGFQLAPAAVPEPSTWAMLAAGGVVLLGYRRSLRRA